MSLSFFYDRASVEVMLKKCFKRKAVVGHEMK